MSLAIWVQLGANAVMFTGMALLPDYYKKKVGSTIDLSVGKALDKHRHELNEELENHRNVLAGALERTRQDLALEREQHARDYSLFATKRNEVYAEIYRLFESTRAGYAEHFGRITSQPDFANGSISDLHRSAGELKLLSEKERRQIADLIDSKTEPLTKAASLLTTLWMRDGLRRTNMTFNDFKREFAFNALYFTQETESMLRNAVNALAVLSAYSWDFIDDGKIDYGSRAGDVDRATEVGKQLRETMQREMRAGFASREF